MKQEHNDRRKRENDIRHKLQKLKRMRERVNMPTWIPDTSSTGRFFQTDELHSQVTGQPSRRFTAEEINSSRKETLTKIDEEEKCLKKCFMRCEISEYQREMDAHAAQGQQRNLTRAERAKRKIIRRHRQRDLEANPRAHHKVPWRMKTNAGNLIIRPFVGTGPSPQDPMPELKSQDLWPVLPKRTGEGIPKGQLPWYHVTSGRDFGDQSVEDFAEHYRVQVLRNAKIREKNRRLRAKRREKMEAKKAGEALRKKSRRPWSACPATSRPFSIVNSIRPPTYLERQKIDMLPAKWREKKRFV